MQGSKERIRKVINHQTPDRPPLFDLIANDEILRHFNNDTPVEVGDDAAAIRALTAATDGTRYSYFSPMTECTKQLDDGREQKYERWSIWTSNRAFTGSEEYRDVKTRELDEREKTLGYPVRLEDGWLYNKELNNLAHFGDDYNYFFWGVSPGLMGIYGEVGLEAFSYYLFDCEDVIIRQLELNTQGACRWAEALTPEEPFDVVLVCEDIAFKTGPMVNPAWLKEHYFPRLKKIIDAIHASGKKVFFHSDGNLNQIMDGLVEAGIDILNPIEIAAGMDLADLHKRYPKLIFAGGIDASRLLPFGSKRDIADAVTKAIDDTEGRILVGSSTEVFNTVPLENYLAMREAALQYRF
ncbi:MAG: hypothetical protein JXA11_13270 [Phycisphaerae bacterium]|nr:hypothetical protein [Phycisphaerae bacterium]